MENYYSDIVAVSVSYNNFDSLKSLCENLLSQSLKPKKFLVVDNASEDDTPKIKELFPEFVVYKRLPKNLGADGGYYYALSYAYRMSDFLFITDDDTLYQNDALYELFSGFLELEKKFCVGAVRCAWEGFEGGKPKEVFSSVWTGVLLKSSVIKVVGFPRKDFFIYGGDDEFFTRMTKKGFKLFLIPSARYLSRPSGHKISYSIFGKKITFYSDIFRLYYSIRNETFIYSRMRNKDFPKVLRRIIALSLILRDRRKIKAILEGFLHGILGVLGENKNYLTRRVKSV
jgi:rhamnopyranosyl-N-acetylglucosaminyl-diphospho-decaprenol beta-1,3/1,4-galactofuranosyltransferase